MCIRDSYYCCRLRDNRTPPLGAVEPNYLHPKIVLEVFSVYGVLRMVWEEVLQGPAAAVKFGGAGTRVAAPTSVQFAISEQANFHLTKLI